MPFSRPCFKDSMERGAGEERGETWGLLLGMEVWHGLMRASLARISVHASRYDKSGLIASRGPSANDALPARRCLDLIRSDTHRSSLVDMRVRELAKKIDQQVNPFSEKIW